MSGELCLPMWLLFFFLPSVFCAAVRFHAGKGSSVLSEIKTTQGVCVWRGGGGKQKRREKEGSEV